MGRRKKNSNKYTKKKPTVTGVNPSSSPTLNTTKPKPSPPIAEEKQSSNKQASSKSPQKQYKNTEGRHMEFILGVSYQITAIVLIALTISAVFYFKTNKNTIGLIWSLYALYCFGGLLITLYALQYYRSTSVLTPEPIPAPVIPLVNPLEGVLVPGSEPTPPHPCQVQFESDGIKLSDDAIAVCYGNSATLLDKRATHTLIRIKSDELLSMKKTKDGILVSAKVFSSDERIIAQLIDNKFYVNPNNYFRIERPNPHTLIVYDQQANEVLYVDFVNKKHVNARGIFHYPNSPIIVLNDTGVKVGEGVIHKYCSLDSSVGIQIGETS